MKPDRSKPTNPKRSNEELARKGSVSGSNSGSKGAAGEEREPVAGSSQIPAWFIVLFGLLLYMSQLYLDQTAGGFHPKVHEPYVSFKQVDALNPKSGDEALIAKGEAVYTAAACLGCHQGSGLGTPLYPPLAGSEWVLGSPDRLIRIPLHGLIGPIEVKGQKWESQMPPLGQLSDEEIAAVLSFIRNSWGNKASIIKPEQVAKVRADTKGRDQQWTAQELLQIP